jgi:Mrp family chromosome partitioning ATPase
MEKDEFKLREEEQVTIRDYWMLFRRNYRTILIFVFLSIFGALIFSLVVPPLYEAKAVVIPPSAEPGPGAGGILESKIAQEYRSLRGIVSSPEIALALLKSRTIREEVVRHFGLDTLYRVKRFEDAVEKLRKRMDVSLKRSGVIEIRVLERNPKLAAEITNYMIDYAEKMNERLQIFLEKPMFKVIDSAIPPHKRSKPRIKVNLIIAFILGLFVALSIVFLKAQNDRRIYASSQVRKFFNEDDFIIIPKMKNLGEKVLREITLPKEQVSAIVAEYTSSSKGGIMVVASPRGGEGKTFYALQLSKILSSMGLNILLVDLNILNPHLHRLFNIEKSPGALNYLRGETDSSGVIFKKPMDVTFDVMPSGEVDDFNFLLNEHISKMEELLNSYDFIIVDTPPLLESSSMHPLIKNASKVFFVIMFSKSTEPDLANSRSILDDLKVKDLKIVLNGINFHIHNIV